MFICFDCDWRSAQIVYKEDSEVHGIKTYRYILGDDNFRAPLSSPETSCFCTQREPRRDICEMNGILDVSSCSDGAPIALSPAHFLDGDTHLTEDVFGLRPSPEKHEMYLDIEPVRWSSSISFLILSIFIISNEHWSIVINRSFLFSPLLPSSSNYVTQSWLEPFFTRPVDFKLMSWSKIIPNLSMFNITPHLHQEIHDVPFSLSSHFLSLN